MKVGITLDEFDIKPLLKWYEHSLGAKAAYQHVDERVAAQVAKAVKDKLGNENTPEDSGCGGDCTGCVCDGVYRVCVPDGADPLGAGR